MTQGGVGQPVYNLFVTAAKGAWERAEYLFEAGRYLEFTSRDVAQRFKLLDNKAVRDRLMTLPTLFAYETPVNEAAQIGWITSIQKYGGYIRITFAFDRLIAPISPETLDGMKGALGIVDSFELNRTHWAIKEVDLLAALAQQRAPAQASELAPYRKADTLYVSSKESERQITFSPHVFQAPEGGVEDDLVALMMPFGKQLDPVRDAITRACQANGLRCVRADSVWQESAIIQDIFNLIFRAQIVVVDFTGKNSNVMYETGIAHTLGKHVIPIAQALEDVPFDIRHHRVLTYLLNGEGIGALEAALKAKLAQFSM